MKSYLFAFLFSVLYVSLAIYDHITVNEVKKLFNIVYATIWIVATLILISIDELKSKK